MRHLEEHACAVADVVFATAGSTVLQVHQNLQCVDQQLVRFLAPDVDDEADAAGIVLISRIVQTLGLSGLRQVVLT